MAEVDDWVCHKVYTRGYKNSIKYTPNITLLVKYNSNYIVTNSILLYNIS